MDVVPEGERCENAARETRDGREAQRVAQEEVHRDPRRERHQGRVHDERREWRGHETCDGVRPERRQSALRKPCVPRGQVWIPQDRPVGEPIGCEGEEACDVGVEDVMRVLERLFPMDEHLEHREREHCEDHVGDPGVGDKGSACAGHRRVSSPLRWFGAVRRRWTFTTDDLVRIGVTREPVSPQLVGTQNRSFPSW